MLILDEPGNGLDPAGIASLRELLRGLATEGRTVLVSSHVLSETAQTVDRVVIILLHVTVRDIFAFAGMDPGRVNGGHPLGAAPPGR